MNFNRAFKEMERQSTAAPLSRDRSPDTTPFFPLKLSRHATRKLENQDNLLSFASIMPDRTLIALYTIS
jgi:hypothetical protein